MKKWQVVLGTMVALVTAVMTPLSAMAQSGGETAPAARPQFKGSLTIVAPRAVAVGKEMSLGVFQRENQEPVPGAGVWALTRDGAEALRKEADILRGKAAAAEDADYEELLRDRGHFLGRTGGDGRLFHTFKDAGDYVLVAAKKGFVPDFSPLVVRGVRASVLVVKAPRTSPPGESVTIAVTEKANGEPVKDAGVWAFTRENAEALKTQIAGIKPTDNNSGAELEALLNGRGILLGTTHGNGELKYTFAEEGVFVLVAFKRGFIPGYTGIAIKNAPKALVVNAPRISPVGEPVTIGINEKGTGGAVKDAGVWALTPAEAEALKSKLANIRTANATADTDIESVVGGFGVFLGRTNGNGELKYTFEKTGRYVLVAVKKGYIPGYTGIGIAAPKSNSGNATAKPALAPKAVERPKPGSIPGVNTTNTGSIRRITTN